MSQEQIRDEVDITAATKYFTLHLNDFGPYHVKYSLNGRHVLIGGRKGHLASFEWCRKKLNFEINVMESIHDLCFLHNETMCATAQKNYVYIYDNQGIELHCIKKMPMVLRMVFLPYHFLLATSNESGILNWLDVTIGELVGTVNTHLGRLPIMTYNPYNALICLGGGKGVVSMWSPNSPKPLAKMLCHSTPINSIAVNHNGQYLATAAVDKSVHIWDLRNLNGPLQKYRLNSIASNLEFSQKNMLAVSMGNIIEVYNDCCVNKAKEKYLTHRVDTTITNMKFCNYEDVLGIGHQRGITSILVPASSEPKFDSYEWNPYQVKRQRREDEIKKILDKIPADLISLEPTDISYVHVPTLQEKIEEKKKIIFLKPPKIDVKSKKKHYTTVKKAKVKKIVKETEKMKFIKEHKKPKNKKKKSNKFNQCIGSI